MNRPVQPGLVLGVDGGNSKSIALVARCDGTVLGAARGGNTDIYGARSADAALTELRRTVRAALQTAGARREDLLTAAFSLAGADWPEDIAHIEMALAADRLGRRRVVVNDAFGALRAGSPDGTGVSVVCGTGGAVGACGTDGTVWHASWWQEPQGSRQLADRTLRAVYRSELGIDPPTSLTRRVLGVFDLGTVEEVLHAHTVRIGPRADRHGDLTRILLDEAERGDRTAARLVTEHGRSLGDLAVVAARRVRLAGVDFPLVLAGGVFRHGGRLLPDALVKRVWESCPGARPEANPLEPAAGAVLLALDLADMPASDEVRERLRVTIPAPVFFAT